MIRYINISLEIFGALLSIVIMCSMLIGDQKKDKCHQMFIYILICNAALLLSDAAAYGFKGNTDWFYVIIVYVANFLVFTLGYVLMVLYSYYLYWFIKQRTKIKKNVLYLIDVIVVISILLAVISQWNHMYYYIDEFNMYHRADWFWLSQVLAISCMLINAGLLFAYRKCLSHLELLCLSSQIVLPIVAMCIQISIYGIALLYIATTISTLIVYLYIQSQAAKQMKEKELELLHSRVSIMLSMIQPHFLYNSLTAIGRLCDIDPQKAKIGVQQIAHYLRENLNSVTNESDIPFEQELHHIEIYLSLEKMRYGELLQVRYDIQYRDFYLPPLLLQPLVENAVNHGIAKKVEGGTVTISSKKINDMIILEVMDDGIGFDVKQMEKLDQSHIGLRNVKNRCEMICGGSMKVESEIGKGSSVMLFLPEKDE